MAIGKSNIAAAKVPSALYIGDVLFCCLRNRIAAKLLGRKFERHPRA